MGEKWGKITCPSLKWRKEAEGREELFRAAESRWYVSRLQLEKLSTAIRSGMTLMGDLSRAKESYERLIRNRPRAHDILGPEEYHKQLANYLRAFRLADFKLAGISETRRRVLTYVGVETAADIEAGMLSNLPELNAYAIDSLLVWRNGLAEKFVPARVPALTPFERDKRLREIEKQLLLGVVKLRKLVKQLDAEHHRVVPLVLASAEELAQARADRFIMLRRKWPEHLTA